MDINVDIEIGKAELAVLGLILLGIVLSYFGISGKIMKALITGIVSVATGKVSYEYAKSKFSPERTATIGWHKYYWRALGYAVSFGGFGLIADELIQGTLDFSVIGHEWYGIILFLVGLGLISIKPQGK